MQQQSQQSDPTERTKSLILIIEDEGLLARMYSKKLEHDGYSCMIAGNGQEGIDTAKKQLPDLILCDVMMPVKDGLTVLKELKENKDTTEIPVIMLSNLSDEKYINEALEMGAISYLIKSQLVPSDVVTKIKETMEATGNASLLSKVGVQ